MPNIRSTGIFADDTSGLFRGTYLAATKVKVPGAGIELLGQREVISKFWDFTGLDEIGDWVATELGTVDDYTNEIGTSGGGVMVSTHNTNDEGHGSIQATCCGMAPAAGRVIAFEVAMSITSIAEGDWFVGIGEVDTTFIHTDGTLLANGADNFVGFHSLDTATTINMSSAGIALANRQDTVLGAGVNYTGQTLTVTQPADLALNTYGCRINGTTSIEFYYNGALVHVRTSDDAFAEIMVPSFGNVAGGAEQRMEIDYCIYAATR